MKYAHQAAVIIAVCFLTRLPQLASPYMFLDGDECLEGLMAKHIWQAGEFPIFFWGQQYGFTLIECLMIIPFYVILGINALAVKLAMLTLWTIGVLFLFKTLRCLNTSHELIPFALTMVFACHPAWAIWAMKARGGYLTAFTLSSIVLYLLLAPQYSKRLAFWIIPGILTILIYESSLFWLCGVLPIMLYIVAVRKQFKGLIIAIVSAVVMAVLFTVYKTKLPVIYVPPVLHEMKEAFQNIGRVPEYFYKSLHGNYYFSFYQSPNLFCAALSVIFCIIIFSLPLLGLYYILFKRRGNGLFIISTLFVPACCFYTLFSPGIEGRYLLPVTGFAILPLQLLANKLKRYKAFFITSGVLTVSGIVAVVTFWNFEFITDRKKVVLETIDYLKANKAQYVFCSDCMVPWQINFYANETITARMPYSPERYPPNGEAVDLAFAQGIKTALMFYSNQKGMFTLDNPQMICNFGVGLNPKKQELLKFYFPK